MVSNMTTTSNFSTEELINTGEIGAEVKTS